MAVHDRHCIALNDADRTAWDAGGHAMLDAVTITGRPRQVRERLAAAVDQGVTEVVFQPCGPDPARELEAFARAARSTAVAS